MKLVLEEINKQYEVLCRVGLVRKMAQNKILFVITGGSPETKSTRDKLEKICGFYDSLCIATRCLESTYTVNFKRIL